MCTDIFDIEIHVYVSPTVEQIHRWTDMELIMSHVICGQRSNFIMFSRGMKLLSKWSSLDFRLQFFQCMLPHHNEIVNTYMSLLMENMSPRTHVAGSSVDFHLYIALESIILIIPRLQIISIVWRAYHTIP